MFKKAFKVQSTNNISGKDKKKLIQQLKKKMNSQAIDEFFSHYETITVNKVSGQKVIIFNCDKYPAFFNIDN